MESNHFVPMTTNLFPAGSYLPEAFGLASEMSVNPEHLRVIFAGCSDGAEIDSSLAIQQRIGYKGRLAVEGYDINHLAIKAAKTGRHTISRALANMDQRQQELHELGFDTFYEMDDRSGRDIVPQCYLIADANRLRDGHQVKFTEHDLTEPLPFTGEADLVFANNLLFHFTPERAMAILVNLGQTMSKNGVLSLGINGLIDISRRERAKNLLLNTFDLKPVHFDYSNQAVMFSRSVLHAKVGLNI